MRVSANSLQRRYQSLQTWIPREGRSVGATWPPRMARARSGREEIRARTDEALAMVAEAAVWKRIRGWSKGSRRCSRLQGAPPWTDRDRQLFLKSPTYLTGRNYTGLMTLENVSRQLTALLELERRCKLFKAKILKSPITVTFNGKFTGH